MIEDDNILLELYVVVFVLEGYDLDLLFIFILVFFFCCLGNICRFFLSSLVIRVTVFVVCFIFQMG